MVVVVVVGCYGLTNGHWKRDITAAGCKKSLTKACAFDVKQKNSQLFFEGPLRFI